MISKRSKISLIQFLGLFNAIDTKLLLKKYFSNNDYSLKETLFSNQELLEDYILNATIEETRNLLDEIIRTRNELRYRISPRYRFNERWEDLTRCLYLDGLKIENKKLIPFDPSIIGKDNVEDDLTIEIKQSDIEKKEEILSVLNSSAESFVKNPPNYNACLNNARVALQELSKKIALSSKLPSSKNFNDEKWGEVLAYLRKSNFINKKQEDGLSGVFSFVSPGSHIPISFNEEEYTRLGWNLVVSMCYFLIKLYNSR